MSPELLALSRAYLALPVAPVRDMIADELPVRYDPNGRGPLRDLAGLLWCPDTGADEPAPWVLDLTDAATGGVMGAAWATAGGSVWIGPKTDGWRARAPGASILDEPSGRGATLAEAVARAAVALGRAGVTP